MAFPIIRVSSPLAAVRPSVEKRAEVGNIQFLQGAVHHILEVLFAIGIGDEDSCKRSDLARFPLVTRGLEPGIFSARVVLRDPVSKEWSVPRKDVGKEPLHTRHGRYVPLPLMDPPFSHRPDLAS